MSYQCIGCLKIKHMDQFANHVIFDIDELDDAVCNSCVEDFFDKVEPTYWVQSQIDRERRVVQIDEDCLKRPEDYKMCNWEFTYGERPLNCGRDFNCTFAALAAYFPKPVVWKRYLLKVLDEERERLKRVSKRVLEYEDAEITGGVEIIDEADGQKKARI